MPLYSCNGCISCFGCRVTEIGIFSNSFQSHTTIIFFIKGFNLFIFYSSAVSFDENQKIPPSSSSPTMKHSSSVSQRHTPRHTPHVSERHTPHVSERHTPRVSERHTLKLSRVEALHLGDYACIASNKLGQSKATVTLSGDFIFFIFYLCFSFLCFSVLKN